MFNGNHSEINHDAFLLSYKGYNEHNLNISPFHVQNNNEKYNYHPEWDQRGRPQASALHLMAGITVCLQFLWLIFEGFLTPPHPSLLHLPLGLSQPHPSLLCPPPPQGC